VNLAQPLQVAPSGTFNGSLIPGSSAAFPGILGICSAKYSAGALSTSNAGVKTLLALEGYCDFNDTLLLSDHPVLKPKGTAVSFEMAGDLSTSGCGLNNQLGMAYGFLGGKFYITNASGQDIVPLCVYYTRLSGTTTAPASINIDIYPGAYTANQTLVGCTADRPANSSLLLSLSSLPCQGTFDQTYNCLSAPVSRCMNSSRGIYDIGVGMSVGGIGLVITTLLMVVVINHITILRW